VKVGCVDNSFIREPFLPQKGKSTKTSREDRKKNEEIKDIQSFTFLKCKINFRVIEQLNFVSGKASEKSFAIMSE